MKSTVYALLIVIFMTASTVCAAETVPPKFIVGAKIHFTHGQGPISELLSLAKQCGITSLYEDLYWVAVEQKKGEYQMPYQPMVDEMVKAGIEPAMVLAYWNTYYNNGGSPVTDESREGYAKYCEYIAGHFKGKIRHYEIWNEWGGYLGGFAPETPREGQTVENLVKLIKYVYPRIKAVDPDAVVQAGWLIEGYLDEMIQLGALKYLDAVSLHAYPFNAGTSRYSPEGWIEWIKLADAKLAKASPDRKIPFYITETGWPTHILADGTPPEKALAYLARMYLLARTVPRLAGIYWYDFQNDMGYIPDNQEAHFGLIDVDMMPKPAWFAMRDISDLVATGEYIGRIETNDPNTYILKFKRKDGKDVLAIWRASEDDFSQVTLNSSEANPQPLQLQKVGHAPLTRQWGTYAFREGEPFIPNKLFITVSETPWLLIGDLSKVSVTSEVRVIQFPESKRPTTKQVILPKEMAFASPMGTQPHTIHFNPQDAMAVRELDTFATVDGWGVLGQNAGPRTKVRHVKKPCISSNGAAELTYDFKGKVNQINDCVYIKPMVLPDDASTLSFRMSGDGSGNMVWVRLKDNTGEVFAYCLTGVPGKDWITVSLDLANRKSDSHWDGNNDGVLDGPVSFHSLAIESNDRGRASHGKAYIDEFVVTRNVKATTAGPSFTTSWDADNIYLTVNVPDKTHYQPFDENVMWKGDSLQVAFQALPSEGPLPRTFSEFTAALTPSGAKLYRHSSQVGLDVGLVKDPSLTIDHKDNLTVYKLVMPVKNLGIPGTLRQGMAVGFSLLVNQNDGQDRSFTEWGSGIGNSKNPMLYNWLVTCSY